nr:hypothetical protein [Oscillospiraceae bacterium]
MREQLIQYVELLFAGAENSEDIKQEILQNTLDRYDDLIAEGRVPEAAYRLAITGIGDINEILGGKVQDTPVYNPIPASSNVQGNDTPVKKLLRAVAVGLYILCPVPLFILSELGLSTIGLCGLLAMVAIATVLIILGAKKDQADTLVEEELSSTPESELQKSINKLIGAICFALYFIVSFATGAWHISWLIFPIAGAVKGLVKAILDLKEAVQNEN